MKKILACVLSTCLGVMVFASGNATERCKKCDEITRFSTPKGKSIIKSNAWRRYDLEIKHYVFKYDPSKKDYVRTLVDGTKDEMIYNCPHGHQYTVSTK